jgi:hypothetical protein
MSFFKTLLAAVESMWKKAPAASVIAASAINNIVPVIETIDTLADPSLALALNPILDKVKVGVSALKVTITTAGSSANVVSIVASINTNMAALLSAAQVKDPATAAKIEAISNLVTSELETIQAAYAPTTSAA